MKKRWIALAAAIFAGLMCIPVQTTPPLIRLHVLAESDSAADQAEKLIVRDAVLARAQQILAECADYTQAYATLDAHMAEITTAAQQASEREDIRAGLVREMYPDRDYGDFTLPQGEYISLKVEIGPAQGQNWWCVVYPSLCMPGSASPEELERLIEPKPLRSILWDWAAACWRSIFSESEVARHA